MANKATDPESKANWLQLVAEWERMADELENAEKAEDAGNAKGS